MGFNLLAFAGGAAKGLTEEIDKREEEAKAYALNSTKMMHERYTKTLENNRQQLSSIEDDLSVIRSNFPGKFSEAQLYNIGISNSQRKQLVEAARDPNIDKSLLDPKQIVKIIEDNTPGTAMERIRQSYAIPSVIAAKAAEAKESGFFSGFGERAGTAAAQKYAGMTGVSLEQMRGAQDWKAPTSTAEFDLTSLVKDKTLPEQLVAASTAVAKYAKLGDTVALQKSKDLFKALSIEQKELNEMIGGVDYAKKLENDRAEALIISSNPDKYSKDQQANAKRILDFERKQAQLHAAAVRVSQGDGTSTSKAASLLDAAIKHAEGAVLVKKGDRQIIAGTNINAATPEGVAKVREAESQAAIRLFRVMGGINPDNSIKDNATAKLVISRGLPYYEKDGNLFLGTQAAASTGTGKTATAPPEAITELANNPSAANKQFFLSTFGYLPEEKLLKQQTSTTPSTTGFATRPVYVPPPTSPAGKSQAMRAKAEEEKVKSSQLEKQAGEKLSSDFSKDVATLSPSQLSMKYDPIRGQLSTADKIKLQAKEREIK